MDIGIVNQAGIITQSVKHPEKLFSALRPSAVHHHESGLIAMKRKRERITKDIDVQMNRATEETLARIRDDFEAGQVRDTDLDLIADDERFLDAKFRVYSKNKLLGMKFTKHVRSHQAVDRFVSSLIPRNLNFVFNYGDGWDERKAYSG